MSDLHLPHRVRHFALERRDRPAVTAGTVTLTYGEFDAYTNRVATALSSVASEPRRIGTLLRMGLPGVAAFIGCAKAGLVFTPLNWRLNPDEVAVIAADAELGVLIVESDFAASAEAVVAAMPHVHIVVVGDAAAVAGARSWDHLVESGTDIDPGLGSDPEAAVLQLYTSGTTGRPKGVVAVHRNLYNVPENFELYEFEDDSVSLNALPLFHVAGAGWISTSLSAGLHLILLGEMRPALVAATIAEHRVTHTFLVPSAIGMILELPDLATYDLSSLALIAYGGSPISPSLLARTIDLLGCRLVQRYGMTETLGALTALGADDHDPLGSRTRLLRSAGKPLPGAEVEIRDIDTGVTLSRGETGEIVSRSRNNADGYWRRDAESAALYTEDGFLRTGDAGHVDDEGYLFVTDRIRDMIITGGENVYPVEVESVLAEHPAVAEVAVVGLPDERWGEAVTAVVRFLDGVDRPTEEELVAFTTERLASYKKPQRIHIVSELPRNASGKILKRVLRDTLSEPGEPAR